MDMNQSNVDSICGSLDAMGDVIKEYRKKAGLTQAGLAEKLDVTRNAVISWETGRAKPQMEMLIKVSHLLSIPITELFHVDRTANGLTADEQNILNDYRRLSPEDQKVTGRMIEVLLEEADAARTDALRNNYRIVPTLETPAAAGPGCDYLDNEDTSIRFYRRNPRYRSADLVCRVSGHSMEPVYQDGDYVYARIARSADDGSDVICDSNDGRMIKRKYGNQLVSLNPDPQYRVHKSEDDGVHIVAVVLGIVPEGDMVEPDIESALEDMHADEVHAAERSRL